MQVRPSLITGSNRVVCEECTAAAAATVRRAYWEHSVVERESLSHTLVINLKRFTVRASQGGANVKINDFLSFPLTLDLTPYTRAAGGPLGGGAAGTSGAGGLDAPADGDACGGGAEAALLYHLRGVIVHKGAASHGHYYALMHRQGRGWYHRCI